MSRTNVLGGFVVLVILASPAARSLGQTVPESWEARLRRELPATWRALPSADPRSLDFEGVKTENLNNQTPQPFHVVKGKDRSLLEISQGESNPGKVWCLVGKRGFVLERNRVGAPYSVSFVGNDDKSGVVGGINRRFPDPWFLMALNQLRDVNRILALFDDPHNHVLGIEPVVQNGKTLVQVRYMHVPDRTDEKQPVDEVLTEMLYDPSHHWVLVSTETHPSSGRDFKLTMEYGDDEDGRPTLKKLRSSQKFIDPKGASADIWQEWAFTKFSYKPAPDSAFTLAAFGLPDFDSPLGRVARISYNYWLLGLAVLFAIVAVATRVRRSRATRAMA